MNSNDKFSSKYIKLWSPELLKMRKYVIFSILMSLPVLVFFATNYTRRLDLLQFKDKVLGGHSLIFSEKDINNLVLRVSDPEYVNEFIGNRSIEENANISDLLFNSKIESRQRAAASLSFLSGMRYRNPPLLYRAARYTMAAPIRDFEKALKILNVEYIAGDGLADYYRGLIWQEPANPDYDLTKARVYFERAREAKIRAAEQMLLNLDARVKRSGNSQK